MNTKKISAIIPTRGDHDLSPIQERLEPLFDELIIWDNSKSGIDLKVYGRYQAMHIARNPVVYVQDDDCLISEDAIGELCDYYARDRITANMPASRFADYPDSCLVGWGAVFDRYLPTVAFSHYGLGLETLLLPPLDQAFLRDCDVVFTALTDWVRYDLGFTHLPWAEGPDRLFKQPGHAEARARILEQCRRIRERAWMQGTQLVSPLSTRTSPT